MGVNMIPLWERMARLGWRSVVVDLRYDEEAMEHWPTLRAVNGQAVNRFDITAEQVADRVWTLATQHLGAGLDGPVGVELETATTGATHPHRVGPAWEATA